MKSDAKPTQNDSITLFSRKDLLRLLWPLVVEQLFTVLVGVVDVMMVAYVGEAAVSGVALVDSVNYLFIQVLFALTAGGTVVCAQFIGAKDVDGAGKTGAQLILASVSLMLLVAIVFLAGGHRILALLFGRVEADVMRNALVYLRITVASLPFMAVYYSAASVFRAKGDTRIAMLASMGMNILNVAGNAICIFGLHMGVVGVALPTLIARMTAAAGVLWLLQRPDNDIRIRSLRQLKPDSGIIRRILSIGVPNGVESGLFNLGKIMLQSLVATLGTSSIAAYAVASSLVTFLYLPGNAVGAGMLTVVGQCHGANKPQQAKRYAKVLVLINYAMLVLPCVVMVAGINVWVGLYSLSPDTAVMARQLVIAHCIAMTIWPVAFTFAYYFRAIGKAKFPMVVSITTMAVCRIGLAYFFVLVLGKSLIWVWYAMFIDWAVRLIAFSLAFKRQ